MLILVYFLRSLIYLHPENCDLSKNTGGYTENGNESKRRSRAIVPAWRLLWPGMVT